MDILDELAEAYSQRDLMELEVARLREEAITPEVKERLNDIATEFDPKFEALSERIAALETAAKSAALAAGETQKGKFIMAVFNKGRVSWDSKALDGYAAGHPEILFARKEGEPTVSIRKAEKSGR